MSFVRKISKSKRDRTQHSLFYLAMNLSRLISTTLHRAKPRTGTQKMLSMGASVCVRLLSYASVARSKNRASAVVWAVCRVLAVKGYRI